VADFDHRANLDGPDPDLPRVSDGERGRSWTLWVCPECSGAVVDMGQDRSYCWHEPDPISRARVQVFEHPTDGEGTDERKWTRAFTRLEKAVQRHRDAKGWTDDADDELHRVLEKVLRDVGPAPARARSDVDAVTISRDEADHILDALGEAYSGYCPEGWNDQAKAVLAGTCDRIRERLQGEGE
jgi:hypothetical protein